MRAKVGLPPRGGFKIKLPSDAESDVEWKPGKSLKKKTFKTTATSNVLC